MKILFSILLAFNVLGIVDAVAKLKDKGYSLFVVSMLCLSMIGVFCCLVIIFD